MNVPESNAHRLESYFVWERSVRWFHWINFLCVLGLAAFGLVILNSGALGIGGDGKVLLKELHVYIGYVFAVNLGWRFVWGFIGNRYTRWKAVLPGGKGYAGELRDYVGGLVSGRPQCYLGHNPLARLMVSLLLLLLLIQTLTGLVLAGTDLYKPPLGGWVAEWVTGADTDKLARLKPGSKEQVDSAAYEDMRRYRKPVAVIHLYAFYTLMAMACLHIFAVVITEIRTRENLISALFSGYKTLNKPPLDR